MRKCSQCGKELGDHARFCGSCGKEAESLSATSAPAVAMSGSQRPAAPVQSSSGKQLCEELQQLAAMLPSFGIHPTVTQAVAETALGPNLDQHTTVVLGEKGRGKTTLINRLLHQDILPVGVKGAHRTIELRFGPTWRAFSDSADSGEGIPGPPFLMAGEKEVSRIEGPARVLQQTTLVDTPGMNDGAADFDSVVIRQALRADLLVVCVSAVQLLSETERILIRQRLLPVTSVPVLIAVTHMDRLETAEDRPELQSRVTRFVEKAGSPRVQALFMDSGPAPSATLLDVERAIQVAVSSTTGSRERAWAQRMEPLLGALQVTAESLPESKEEVEPPPPDLAESLIAALQREHELALLEAETWLRSKFADVRMSVSTRFSSMSLDRVRHEGLSELMGAVQSLGREAGELYVRSLERALLTSSPSALGSAAHGLTETASGHFGAGLSVMRLQQTGQKRPGTDPKIVGLAALGIGMAAIGAPILLPALTLLAAHRLVKVRDEDFEQEARHGATDKVLQWLNETEADMLTKLRETAGKVLEALRDRITAMKSQPPAKVDMLTTREVLTRQIRSCLELSRAVVQELQGAAP